jgi:hypothetical protein
MNSVMLRSLIHNCRESITSHSKKVTTLLLNAALQPDHRIPKVGHVSERSLDESAKVRVVLR